MANTVTKSNGDVMLAHTMPKAEYMYGCMPTSVGMILGYYDLYGYNGKSLSNLISGTVAVNSRGTDGNAYDMDAFDTVLGKAIASKGYVSRFYGTTPEEELPHTYKGSTTELNTSEWDCIADYLGTGQYWRGNGDKATTETSDTVNDLYTKNYTSGSITYGSTTRTILWRNISMQYGLDLYVQSRGYSLDRKNTGSFKVDTNGGSFTFEDFKKEIDAGRPVVVSITGHAMVAYGYNASTKEIIFDDCYDADQRMKWGSTYYYSGASRPIESIITIVFNVSGGGGGGGSGTTDTTKPTVSNLKVSTTSPTNKAVTVTATFSDNVAIQSSLYRIGTSGSWKAYPSGGVSVSKNSTVYFQAVDTSGNKSAVASYKVTNIDTTAPSKPTISVSTKKSTTNPVTVTAKFSSDSSKKEYSTDGKTWKSYSGTLTFKSNGNVYFRGTDAAGNVSAVASYTISNIKGSSPAPTPTDPSYDTSACDNSKNDWLVSKDKSGKTLRNSDSNLVSATVTGSGEIKLDTKSVSVSGKHNFVGYVDEADFAKIRLNSAAKLSLSTVATGASKFTVYAVTTKYNKKGVAVYSMKTIKTVSLKKKKGASDYTGELDGVMLNAGDYYVAMKSPGTKKSSYYNVTVDSDSVFFTKGNNSDDSSVLSSMKSVSVASPGAKLLDDWVGFGDTIDYRKFTLAKAAKLSFILNAGNAAKFTLYKVVTKGSKSSLKTVKSVSAGKGKSGSTALGLLKGGTYVLSVKSTAPAKSENANYSLSLSSNSVFYNHSDSSTSDNEVIFKFDGQSYVNSSVGNVGDLYNATPYVIFASGWVGYGDTIDYKGFSLKNEKTLTFGIQATDRVQFTIYELVSKTSGSKTTHSLKKKKSWTPRNNGAGNYLDHKMSITLKAGKNYYFSVKSTNASKGGNAEYSVFLLPNDISLKDALSMPEASAGLDAWNASSSAANPAQDLLSFGQYDGSGSDVLANVSAAAGFDSITDDSSAWKDVAKLA